MIESSYNHQNKTKTKLLKKLIASVMKDGFQNLRMDDIAKYMDVSRATMYKYFSSKEEVIEGVVNVFADYINELVLQTSDDTELSFAIRFQKLFEQSVLLIGKISDVFLRDLQAMYPDLNDRLKDAMHQREQQAISFYQEGMKNGIFNQFNEKFILLQDDILLREIIDVKYLLLNQVSLQQVLYDYYTLKKVQLFKADKLLSIDDAMIHPIIEHIAKKFNQSL